MEVRVSPTRMQLLRLKKRLGMAERGHKLLKDKRDELMKKFLDLIREEQALRRRVEAGLAKTLPAFLEARAAMSSEALEEAFMAPKVSCGVDVATRIIMNVKVPEFTWLGEKTRDVYPYGFFGTSASLDDAVAGLSELLPVMTELAEVEKSIELLADEIEKTRRRVNALEYVLIPNLRSTARYITMKLDEMERGNLTRLMKVKDIVRAKQA